MRTSRAWAAPICMTIYFQLRSSCAKAYGISNWLLDSFVEAYEYCQRMGYQGPSVYSPFFSLVKIEKPWYDRIPTFKEGWLPWLEEHRDGTVAAWSAHGRGFFGNYPQFLPENDDPAERMAVLTPKNFARKERDAILAGMKGIRPSQVSLLYVLSQKVNIAAIIGPCSIKDIDSALNATSLRLTAEELDFLHP